MSHPGLQVRLLGPVAVRREGVALPLPRSRKVRALLAYLALAAGAVSRSRLCALLWDIPNDPRGELRWCLSKLRSLLDDGSRRRVVADAHDAIALDLSDCTVDALWIERALKANIAEARSERLSELCAWFGGELLENVQIDGNPEFNGWLAAQRHRFRTLHVAVRRELAARPLPAEQTFQHLDVWLQLAPYDQRAHEVMLQTLVKCGRVREAEEHVTAAIRSFEREGLDSAPLRDAWQAGRAAAESALVTARSEGSRPGRPGEERTASTFGGARRVSVAVMPFVERFAAQRQRGGAADGLTEDVITRLAKLRSVFVIARGSVFALGERGIGVQEAGRLLGVEYVVSGSLRLHDRSMSVVVELAETESARIVWADTLEGDADTLSAFDAIADRVVAAVTKEIEASECRRAVLKPPSSLDAWEAYHRGLWHMYKFTGSDNHDAEHFFRQAVRLDSTFASAYAALSFAHFQNAFLELTPDRDAQIDLAFQTAVQSLGADDQDPAAHWAMGRALWLRGELRETLTELERSVELSPNFALGHYTLGFVRSQSGDARAAIEAADHSRELSPFDPLQFAMLASRALAHVRLGEPEEAAHWAVRAAARPNAHAHILAIAAHCLALADRRDEARAFVSRARTRVPDYGLEHFLRAFRFAPDAVTLFRKSARRIGF